MSDEISLREYLDARFAPLERWTQSTANILQKLGEERDRWIVVEQQQVASKEVLKQASELTQAVTTHANEIKTLVEHLVEVNKRLGSVEGELKKIDKKMIQWAAYITAGVFVVGIVWNLWRHFYG